MDLGHLFNFNYYYIIIELIIIILIINYIINFFSLTALPSLEYSCLYLTVYYGADKSPPDMTGLDADLT